MTIYGTFNYFLFWRFLFKRQSLLDLSKWAMICLLLETWQGQINLRRLVSEEIIELWRWSARNKQQCKDYLTFELMCAVVHLSPEALQMKTILIKVESIA